MRLADDSASAPQLKASPHRYGLVLTLTHCTFAVRVLALAVVVAHLTLFRLVRRMLRVRHDNIAVHKKWSKQDCGDGKFMMHDDVGGYRVDLVKPDRYQWRKLCSRDN